MVEYFQREVSTLVALDNFWQTKRLKKLCEGFNNRLRFDGAQPDGFRIPSLNYLMFKINWCPDFVFGSGPTQSIITRSNGSPIAGIGCKELEAPFG